MDREQDHQKSEQIMDFRYSIIAEMLKVRICPVRSGAR